ncbi:hypothetical protein HHK36_006646 [Tetracentron sinense]|uniref:non-specific serine/threonine protein kinase n=1 Tax=Tetracentron sinense TaxID=13715 RepID=A0A834ZS54_TETSI|nr:hypothetical protein HHK36_006646 [Tetracentron sinense]
MCLQLFYECINMVNLLEFLKDFLSHEHAKACSSVGNMCRHSPYFNSSPVRNGAEEDKTKANAAGALSNLFCNSNKLCEEIVSRGAIQVYATGKSEASIR